MLTANTQYPSVLMLKIGALIHQVSLATVEPVSIIVYSLLDTVVTLIGYSKTLGEHHGVNQVISDLEEVEIPVDSHRKLILPKHEIFIFH